MAKSRRRAIEDYEKALSSFIEDRLIHIELTNNKAAKFNCEYYSMNDFVFDAIDKSREIKGLSRFTEEQEIKGEWELAMIFGTTDKRFRYQIVHTKRLPKQTNLFVASAALKITPAELCRCTVVDVTHNGGARQREVTLARKRFHESWTPVLPGYDRMDYSFPVIAKHMLWGRRNIWHVSLGMEETARLVLPTDITGVKGLFQLRDKPEGRDRRSALLHWVREHYRKNRYNPDDEIFVKKHLRGAEEFQWFGLRGQVLLPQSVVYSN